MSKNGLKQGW